MSVIILYTFFLLVRFIYMIDTTYTPMTIAQIEAEYDEKLFARLGENGPFRGKILSPLFSNLYEQKVVYREKMRIFILRMEEMTADERGFRATVRRSACAVYRRIHQSAAGTLVGVVFMGSVVALLPARLSICPVRRMDYVARPESRAQDEELYLQGEMERLLSCFFNDML